MGRLTHTVGSEDAYDQSSSCVRSLDRKNGHMNFYVLSRVLNGQELDLSYS